MTRAKRISTFTGRPTALTEETELQCAAFVRYDKQCRLDRTLRENTRLFAINPIPGKSVNQAILAKRMGLRAGVYDAVFHDMRSGSFVEIWIEFKAEDGRLTQGQRDWADWLRGTPVQSVECRNLNEFERIVGI